MSYQYSNFENTIPIVEKWINKTFSSYIDVGIYEENNIKYNYYILDRDDDNKDVSYILRVKEPLKNYQIYSCGAGGSGGMMYGKGGNGGNYLYIDNLNVNPSIKNRQLAIGSYLIIPGKAVDTINELENDTGGEFKGILNNITLNSSFYLIRYDNRYFNNYKNSLQTIDRYKTRDWNKDNTIGEIINITSLNLIKNEKIDIYENTTRSIELIFYLKKNKSFRFNEFNNPNYTRLIRISNNNNINTLLIPSIGDNYIYTAGDYDEVISILCFPNGNSIQQINKIDWTTLFDIDYALSSNNKNNYYVYDFNKRNDINKINSLIDSVSYTNIKKNTSIYYNSNPDATYNLLEDKIDKYYLGLQGGANGFLLQITLNRYATISTFLKRYYMPYLFSVDNNTNLQGGSAGSTFMSSSGNIIINKLGGTNFIKLNRINPTNVGYYTNNNEWISGGKGYYNTNFKIYAYYKKDQNIELNNTTLSNGGYSGYWQFIKDEINYKYGATGINDLTSPNYGTYGCGGQGGSVIIDKNSKFTGSKGKDGVFILSFINYAIANIVNNNSSVIQKMTSLFITSGYNKKLEYINDLKNNNQIIDSNTNENIISKIINNTFIHEANIHLNDTYITKLESFINKDNLIQILAISYIIQRIYYIINSNSKLLEELDVSKVSVLEILFIDDINKEEIKIIDAKLSITIYDKYNDIENNRIIGYKYLKTFLEPLNKSNYHQLFSLNELIDNYLNSKKKIIIIKENDILYDMTNDIKTNINDLSQNSFYNFLIINIAYFFDIPKKDLKINIKVIETIFQVIRLNSIIYAIFYNSYNQIDYKSKAIINRIYSNLKDYNYDIKKFTDKIELSNNIFMQQNEFKLYFNNKIIEYDKLLDKNIQTANIIKSKKSFMDGKEALKKVINTITIIVTIIIIIVIIWILLLLILNISDFNVIPQLFLILLILIISIIIINYYEKYYSYKEQFIDDNIKQIEIFNSTNNYSTIDITYNESKYKITFINSNSEFILYKNDNTTIILIQGGEDAIETTKSNSDGSGGTINIYDSDYISNKLQENNKNKIIFNSKSIIINDNIKTTNRNNLDNKENIKVIYNNDANTINNNKYTTLKSYYDNLNENQDVIKEIIDILFQYSKNSYYYGSKGNTINQGDYITKFNYPASYGIGGIYNSKDKTGNNGVMIIITKEKEIEEDLHTDIQTLINFYNNNINKLIYDNFNNIYLIDNTVIYNNAVNAFKKRLETETDKEKNFRLYGEKINSYSHIILMDVYYKFSLVKLFILILIGIIVGLILYYLNKNLWILILILVIFIILFLVINFIYTTNKTTRMDYYKYYWSKYNNNSY